MNEFKDLRISCRRRRLPCWCATYDFVKISKKKLHEIENILGRGAGHAGGASLDPTLELLFGQKSNHSTEVEIIP